MKTLIFIILFSFFFIFCYSLETEHLELEDYLSLADGTGNIKVKLSNEYIKCLNKYLNCDEEELFHCDDFLFECLNKKMKKHIKTLKNEFDKNNN